MKTGGTTFAWHISSNFARDEIYPNRHLDPVTYDEDSAYFRIDYLLALSPERHAQIRIYTGHFPFAVSSMLGGGFRVFTILRDPVDRTISYLKHAKRDHADGDAAKGLYPPTRNRSLEEIYEDPFYFHRFIHEHQTKQFAVTADDALPRFFDVLEMDDERLATAKANLEQVDLLGVHERYDEFLNDVAQRYGWRLPQVAPAFVGPAQAVSDSFRRRIANDNPLDMEFYEYACELTRAQRQGSR